MIFICYIFIESSASDSEVEEMAPAPPPPPAPIPAPPPQPIHQPAKSIKPAVPKKQQSKFNEKFSINTIFSTITSFSIDLMSKTITSMLKIDLALLKKSTSSGFA